MIKVAVKMPAAVVDAADFLADVRAVETAGASMIALDGDSAEQWVLLGAIAAVTDRIRIRVTGSEPDILHKISRGRTVAGNPPGESWEEVPMPADRESWAAMLRDREAAGVVGVLVPWDPRVIDLLRNPDPDDRSDLLMSTG